VPTFSPALGGLGSPIGLFRGLGVNSVTAFPEARGASSSAVGAAGVGVGVDVGGCFSV
jgi:hypothetical protein